MPGLINSIDFFIAKDHFSLNTDTAVVHQDSPVSDSVSQSTTETIATSDTIKSKNSLLNRGNQGLDLQGIDSILRLSEERARQIELQMQQEAAQMQKLYKPAIDTSKILFREFGVGSFPVKERLDNDPFNQNFLLNLSVVKPATEKNNQGVFIEESLPAQSQKINVYKEQKPRKDIIPTPIETKGQFNWITILLIGTFILFGWVRLFNKKYLLSLLKSTISYQEAHALYRDKNSLMQRASFIGNFIFVSNVSLFVVQLIKYFELSNVSAQEYEIYLFVFACLAGLYIFRTITTGFIGFIFLKQRVFSEFFHHVNLFTKNVGIFLFPVVISLQFIAHEYIDFIVYIGFGIVVIFYFLQILRSFQIINRKNVSIFYMILYLCAFEFAPFLIIYKMLLTLF
ncbi:MAG: DUF4271 domain-containing protein [Thiohalospira sp.]